MEPLDLEIQSRVHEAMEKHRLSLSDIGSKAGVSPVILNLYLQSKYRGEVRAVTLKLLDWLSRLDQAKQASRIPSRQSGSPEKVAVAAILSRQRQAEVPMAANADAAVVRQRLLQAQQQQIAAAAALLQNNPAQAAAQGVTVQKLNEMMNTQRQLVGAAGGTGAPVKMPMTPVGAGTIRRAGFARQEAEKVDDGSVDFRCIGGKPIIAITIREKHVNSVYEDHILWNVNDVMVTPEMFVASVAKDRKLSQIMQSKVIASLKRHIQQWSHKIELTPRQIEFEKIHGPVEIQLSITFKGNRLKDKILWESTNLENSPEDFATQMCTDLGLEGEWPLLIAHSIRLQLLHHLRAVAANHSHGRLRYFKPNNASIFTNFGDITKHQQDFVQVSAVQETFEP